jgi:hypothetical protein
VDSEARLAARLTALRARMAADPAFAEVMAEEFRCLAESVPYMIRPVGGSAWGEWGPPIRCEVCGTPVRFHEESAVPPPGGRRAWRPGIWETGAGGWRHTGRRCQWRREHAGEAARYGA